MVRACAAADHTLVYCRGRSQLVIIRRSLTLEIAAMLPHCRSCGCCSAGAVLLRPAPRRWARAARFALRSIRPSTARVDSGQVRAAAMDEHGPAIVAADGSAGASSFGGAESVSAPDLQRGGTGLGAMPLASHRRPAVVCTSRVRRLRWRWLERIASRVLGARAVTCAKNHRNGSAASAARANLRQDPCIRNNRVQPARVDGAVAGTLGRGARAGS
jgi:hypothetical protein